MSAYPYASALGSYQSAVENLIAAAKAQSHVNSEVNRNRVHQAKVSLIAYYNSLLTQLQEKEVEPRLP